MNVLLTCAGRRSYLVKYFQDSIKNEGKVYVANSTADATAMIVADGAFVAPPLYAQEEYVGFLKNICKKYAIQQIVPLLDLELPILAKYKSEFKSIGVNVVVSSLEIVDICNDKMKTANFSNKLKIKTLFTTTNLEEALQKIESGELEFPLYIKPRWGMGSIAMQIAENKDELKVLYKKSIVDVNTSTLKYYYTSTPENNVIIQEKSKGQEYVLDVVNDFEGNYLTTFVKKKLSMRSGEADGAITENHSGLQEFGRLLGTQLGHTGILDVDVFWDEDTPILIEMNARIGGSYPFSHVAGADIPTVYIEWEKGNDTPENCLKIEYGVKGFKQLDVIKYNSIKLLKE